MIFTAFHAYWAIGGRIGFGDQENPLPQAKWDVAGVVFNVVVGSMFVAGLVVPVGITRRWGAERWRRWFGRAAWAGCALLVARGGSGLLDGALRSSGWSSRGLTGLSDEELFGSSHPSRYTVWSSAAVDAYFLLGGVLYGRLASASRRSPSRSRRVNAGGGPRSVVSQGHHS